MFYFIEAVYNLFENKKNTIVFFVFLTISFIGIVTTDSLIYSVSQRAEAELKINGDNVITVRFSKPVSIDFLKKTFTNSEYNTSFSRRFFMRVGDTPFSENIESVQGVDYSQALRWMINSHEKFDGNVVILSEESQYSNRKYVYINGVIFKVVGVISRKKTEFLDSLGLTTNSSNANYLIPLQTLTRLTLENTVDYMELLKRKKISNSDIFEIKESLHFKNNVDYSVSSFLDAKKIVDKVMNRFSLLTDFVYLLFTSISIIVISTACKRNFQLRRVEFALKVIHGVDKKFITRIVMLETFLVTILSLIASLVVCSILLSVMIKLLSTELNLRFTMTGFALFLMISVCYITSVLSGKAFFRKNPVDILNKE